MEAHNNILHLQTMRLIQSGSLFTPDISSFLVQITHPHTVFELLSPIFFPEQNAAIYH